MSGVLTLTFDVDAWECFVGALTHSVRTQLVVTLTMRDGSSVKAELFRFTLDDPYSGDENEGIVYQPLLPDTTPVGELKIASWKDLLGVHVH